MKKGRSRVEALMMGCVWILCGSPALVMVLTSDVLPVRHRILRSYEPGKSARIEAATRSALAGEPFTPIEPVERPRAKAEGSKRNEHDEAADALARMWHRSLLDGDAAANADVFGSLARRGEEWAGPDRVELRQLIVKAQSEVRAGGGPHAACGVIC